VKNISQVVTELVRWTFKPFKLLSVPRYDARAASRLIPVKVAPCQKRNSSVESCLSRKPQRLSGSTKHSKVRAEAA
jgi:hypothetical protein